MPPFRRRMGPGLRRMPPSRGRMPPPTISPAARAALRRLAQAHDSMDRGAFQEAGAVFAELAEAAERLNIPRAPQLYLQAGRAWLRAGSHDKAPQSIRHAFRLMMAHGQERRLRAALPALAQDLRTNGMHAEAQALEAEFAPYLQVASASSGEGQAIRERVRLPPKCPYCGGTVRPEEVDWVGEAAAQCDYCGSVVEGES